LLTKTLSLELPYHHTHAAQRCEILKRFADDPKKNHTSKRAAIPTRRIICRIRANSTLGATSKERENFGLAQRGGRTFVKTNHYIRKG